jgi:hypothetical protein
MPFYAEAIHMRNMEMSFFGMLFYAEAMRMRSIGMSFFVVCPLHN